jgi:hypothetical protein
VFTTVQGRPIDPTNVTRTFNTLLRHSAATLLLEQGVELVVIKELLGHAHIGVTATVYAHVRIAFSATPSTCSATRSAAPDSQTAADTTVSAAVAVNYCRQAVN